MRIFIGSSVFLLGVLVMAPITLAQVPDPGFTTVTFPDSVSSCPGDVRIHATVAGVNGAPIRNPLVAVVVTVVAGSLTPESQTYAEARGNEVGEATVVFEGMLEGPAIIFLEVYANGIKMDESPRFPVGTGCAIPVRPVHWGALKRRFGRA